MKTNEMEYENFRDLKEKIIARLDEKSLKIRCFNSSEANYLFYENHYIQFYYIREGIVRFKCVLLYTKNNKIPFRIDVVGGLEEKDQDIEVAYDLCQMIEDGLYDWIKEQHHLRLSYLFQPLLRKTKQLKIMEKKWREMKC